MIDDQKSCSSSQSDEYPKGSDLTPVHEQHPVQRYADRILDECLRRKWNVALIYAGELVHYCLGRGYHALARIAKKLWCSLMPITDELCIRRYLLRMMWLLARVKREKNYRFLISSDKTLCQLKRYDSPEIHVLKFHFPDPEAFTPPMSQDEITEPRIARLLASETPTFSDSLTKSNHFPHAICQPPHIKFSIRASVEK